MVVSISKIRLLKYWEVYANDVLPWLQGRPITIEQVFDGKVIYRRYEDKTKTQLVHINSTEDILKWAYRHTYSFHPYICHDKQTAPCWYVLDIDPEPSVDFEVTKKITSKTVTQLKKILSGFEVTTAFCGKNGFHLFAITKWTHKELFEESKNISLELVKSVYKDALNLGVQIDLTSKEEQQHLQEWLKNRSISQTGSLPRIHFDTRILHRFGNIRSPYSIHPVTGLSSVIVADNQILSFKIDDARLIERI